jgi:CheY-specific phosphatase CheX
MSTALTAEAFALYQECFRQAVGDTLKATCGVSIQPLGNDSDVATHEVIIGIISLVGDAELTMFIGLPRGTAPALVAKFAGFEVPFESPDMGDAVGEVANVFVGSMKNILDAKNIKVNISLPTVMRAENLQVLLQHGGPSAKMGFGSDLGPLWVGIAAGKGGRFIA